MSYPIFSHKYLYAPLFKPEDYLRYKGVKENSVPKRIILVYQSHSKHYFKDKFKGKFKSLPLIKYNFLVADGVGIIESGIGAPAAVALAEDFIAAGAREIISIGTAGGLRCNGIFLCKKALRDEGTSYHYAKRSRSNFAYADRDLTCRLGAALNKNGVEYKEGISWTTDAPFRETKEEVERYSSMGISTVEMEASALFVLGKLKKVKVASGFVVSDVLGDVWEPRFNCQKMNMGLELLVDSAVSCL